MDFLDIELLDCPVCNGPGLLEEENGWCMYISWMGILPVTLRSEMEFFRWKRTSRR